VKPFQPIPTGNKKKKTGAAAAKKSGWECNAFYTSNFGKAKGEVRERRGKRNTARGEKNGMHDFSKQREGGLLKREEL